MWTPCSPGSPGASEKRWTQVQSDLLHEGPATRADAEAALARTPSSVDPTSDDCSKMSEFTEKLGLKS